MIVSPGHMSDILHPEIFESMPVTGEIIRKELERQIGQIAIDGTPFYPGVSVLIRTRNDTGPTGFLQDLLRDVQAQEYPGEVQVVVVDTESTDGTQRVAEENHATVVPIKQEEFTYPRALNLGFQAAKHPYVLSLVGHSLLAHRHVLRKAIGHFAQPGVAGVSGLDLPSTNASRAERVGASITHPARMRKRPTFVTRALGLLAANKSMISKGAWAAAGGFDEAYAAGGEDEALAETLIQQGWKIVEDPALAVHHSHNLGVIAYMKQVSYWQSIKAPQPFSRQRLLKFRNDLH